MSWSKQEVSEWISTICKEYEINESEVELLKNQNGKGLDDLPENLWIRRSPNHGDTLFLRWQELKEYWKLKSDKEDENENAGRCAFLLEFSIQLLCNRSEGSQTHSFATLMHEFVL